MAQAGIHSLIGVATRKWSPAREWLMLGVVLGNLFPDADNLAVAVATVIGQSTEGLHRTFTHSLFTVLFIILIFQAVAAVVKQSRWGNMGLGLGIGILMHVLLDLLIWFDGVAILWPLPMWVNFWEGVAPPEWFSQLMMPVEMLFFALYFFTLYQLASKQKTDQGHLKSLRIWTGIQAVLFLLFVGLVYTMTSGFVTVYGVVYLLSLIVAWVITVQMRQTIAYAV